MNWDLDIFTKELGNRQWTCIAQKMIASGFWLTIQKIHREIFFHEILWRIIGFGQTSNEYPNYELIINVVYKLSSFSY